MSCLIPKELTDLKTKATEFAEELEGDILDKVKEIKASADGLLTDLENALPKLPEIPDLQAELAKLVTKGEKEANEALKGLKEKYGASVPDLSAVKDILNGNFDFCSVPAVKADGTVKSAPPAKPIDTPPAAPVAKPVQDKVKTEEIRTSAGGLAHRSLVRSTTNASLFVMSEKFTERYPQFKELSEEALLTKQNEAYRWCVADLLTTFCEKTGAEYNILGGIFKIRMILKIEEYNRVSEEYLADRKGEIWKNAEKQFDKLNNKKDWGVEFKVVDMTFDEAIQIYYEDVYKEDYEKIVGEK